MTDHTCTKFKDIYADGKDLCESMWGDAFVYSTDPNAYSMWFTGSNPNDAVSAALKPNQTNPVDDCHLNNDHTKEAPTPEGDDFNECHPWKESSCCNSTINGNPLSPNTLNTLYGTDYRWDRCGGLSQACERFFVAEACFYECDPNVGLWRKHVPPALGGDYNHTIGGGNEWEIVGMPIRADECDAFYTACANDMFLACSDPTKKGFFDCSRFYEPPTAESGLSTNNKIVLGVFGGLAAVSLLLFGWIVYRERAGRPVFRPLKSDEVETAADLEMEHNTVTMHQ